MDDTLDKATSIWGSLLTPGQLQSLGIKPEAEDKPNKRPRRKDRGSSTTGSTDDQTLNLMKRWHASFSSTRTPSMCCFRNFSLYCFFNQGKGACFQYYWPVIKPGRRGIAISPCDTRWLSVP